MNKKHVIITMAGEGKRFIDAGIITPKPLIDYKGQPLFVNAVKSIDGIDIDTITFVVRKEHIDKFNIDKFIYKTYPNAIVIAINKTTRGAAETAYIAVKNLIDNNLASINDGILIMDCDVVVCGNNWKDAIKNCKDDGILLTFNSADARYSYAIEECGKVVMLAEKYPISSHALTSPYYINKITDFIDAFNDMENSIINLSYIPYNEMYMSVLFNFLIGNNKNVILVDVDNIVTLGTPEELKTAKET